VNNFLPDIGRLITYSRPQGLGIRVDDGFDEGMSIPIYYDPMISKLITHGKDREEARNRMIRAIDDYHISGVETTLSFCKFAMNHEVFVSGNYDTNFVNKFFTAESLQGNDEELEEIAVLFASHVYGKMKNEKVATNNNSAVQQTKWKLNRKL